MASISQLRKTAKHLLDSEEYEEVIPVLNQMKDARTTRTLQKRSRRALAEVHFRLAARQMNDDLQEAKKHLLRALELREDDAIYAYYAGVVHQQLGEAKRATDYYRMAHEAGLERATYALVLAQVEQGKAPADIAVWDELSPAQQKQAQGEATGPLGAAFDAMEASDWEQARPLLEQVVADETGLSAGLARYYLGVLAARDDEVKEALSHWEQATAAKLTMPDLTHNLTLAYTLAAEDDMVNERYTAALKRAEAGLKLDSNHTRLQDIEAHSRLALGVAEAQKGRWEKALYHWEAPSNAQGVLARFMAANAAIAYEKLERWYGAAEAWREFARRRPRKKGSAGWLDDDQVARLWTRIGELYMRANEPYEAVNTLTTALKYDADRPDLNLSLVRAYIDNQQYEAAENQVDRFLKKNPNHAEALALKAEFVEKFSSYWARMMGGTTGIEEWERVEATGDEVYAPLARQRLNELYREAFVDAMNWRQHTNAREMATKLLERKPDAHEFRAMYVRALVDMGASDKEVDKQIAQIDLSAPGAAVTLINGYYLLDMPDEAEEWIARIQKEHGLIPEAFLDLASMAFYRDDLEHGERHIERALEYANEDELAYVKTAVGHIRREQGEENRARELWEEVVKEHDGYGPAQAMLAMLKFQYGDVAAAKRLLKKAEAWSKKYNDSDTQQMIEGMRKMMDNPFLNLFGYEDF